MYVVYEFKEPSGIGVCMQLWEHMVQCTPCFKGEQGTPGRLGDKAL